MCKAASYALVFALAVGSASAQDEVGFSPMGGAHDARSVVLDAIHSARKSVHVAAFQLSDEPVLQALNDARHRGVDVRVVLDHKFMTKKNPDKKSGFAETLIQGGVGVRVDAANRGVMHNKFIVIDGTSVETGSLNYTRAADTRSANNTLWLRSEPSIAATYETEWNRLWNESGGFTPTH